jgi:hypothetical protein
MADEAQSEKLVVLSTLVNDWPQGTVIDRRQLVFPDPRGGDHPDFDAHDRLRAMGAIRPLGEHEAGLSRVPLPQGGLSTEAQLKLGQLDATIDQLTRTVGSLSERFAFHAASGPIPTPAPEEDPAVAAAIAERQARLDHLQKTAELLAQRLNEAQQRTAEADTHRGEMASEARGGREMPTGQALPFGTEESPAQPSAPAGPGPGTAPIPQPGAEQETQAPRRRGRPPKDRTTEEQPQSTGPPQGEPSP